MKYRVVLIISVIITILSILSGAVNWVFQFMLIIVIYFLSGIFVLKIEIPDKKIIKTILILTLPFILVYDTVIIYSWIKELIKITHLLPILLAPLFGMILAYIVSKNKAKKSSIFLFALILGFVAYISMKNWLEFAFDNENPINKNFPELVLTDLNSNPYKLKKGKIIILDLWATNCGSCIKKFPEFEDLKLEYENDENVEFYTLNLPLKRDSTLNMKKYVENYKFESLFAKKLDSWEKLNNRTVPKLLVLDKELRIIYKGSMNDKWYLFYNNIHSIINNTRI